jgi:hypothetical protein
MFLEEKFDIKEAAIIKYRQVMVRIVVLIF